MKTHFFVSLCFAWTLCFFGSQGVFAQMPGKVEPITDTSKYLVITADGTEYVGLIILQDSNGVWLQTHSLGQIQIPKVEIKSIQRFELKNDPNMAAFNSGGVFTTRYQFTTNCFPIKKGENYALCNLYGPEFHYAVHRDFSVGVMTTWMASPIILALKYTRGTANPKINYGAGALFGSSGYLNAGRGYGGLYWGMITYGDRRNNITLSIGYGNVNDGTKATYTETIYVPGTYQAVNGSYPNLPVQDVVTIGGASVFDAAIIGLAGHIQINEKRSFIYDCMYLNATNRSANHMGVSQYPDENYGYVNTSFLLQQVIVPQAQYWDKGPGSKSNIFVLLPSIRLERSAKKALQLTFGGIITEDNFMPLPMASWFFRL
jgi:hypothetical protein